MVGEEDFLGSVEDEKIGYGEWRMGGDLKEEGWDYTRFSFRCVGTCAFME